MTSDLNTQVRNYTEFFVSTVEPVGLDEILAAGDRVELEEAFIEPIQQATPLQVWWRDNEHSGEKEGPASVRPLWTGRPTVQRHRWAVALVTVVSVLVLVGAVNWLLRSGVEDSSVVTQPPPPNLSSSTWSRVSNNETVFGDATMRSVTAGGPGLVAVGGTALSAAVWTSVDGVNWLRVPHDEAVFSGEAMRNGGEAMRSVTAGGPGLVAVGSDSAGEALSAAVLTSVDGVTWSRVPHDEAIFGGISSMRSVTAGGPGLVAVGSAGAGTSAAVWTSVDGINWIRVPHDEAVFGGEGFQGMTSVTVGGPGLVAVGSDGAGTSAAVWTSVDGITWIRVPHDEAFLIGVPIGGGAMSSVTAGGPGLVAVGAADRNAAVWTSVDGINWSRVPHDEAVFGGEGFQSMRSVTVGGPGLVAVGRVGGEAAVWTSVDGVTWSRVPPDEAVFGGAGGQLMRSVTVGGPGLVAVGDADTDAAVWVAVPEN